MCSLRQHVMLILVGIYDFDHLRLCYKLFIVCSLRQHMSTTSYQVLSLEKLLTNGYT